MENTGSSETSHRGVGAFGAAGAAGAASQAPGDDSTFAPAVAAALTMNARRDSRRGSINASELHISDRAVPR
jgi:hypothetical protein